MIAEKIKALREARGWSQAELSRRLGITRNGVNSWEQGLSMPSPACLVDLAKAFNQGVGFAIGLLLLPFVFNLILAFGGAQYMDGSFANTQPDMVEDVVNKARDAVSSDQNDR